MNHGMIDVVIRRRPSPGEPKLSPQIMWLEVHHAARANVFGISVDVFRR